MEGACRRRVAQIRGHLSPTRPPLTRCREAAAEAPAPDLGGARVEPLGAFGARVHGISLCEELGEKGWAAIGDMLHRHKLLVFPAQTSMTLDGFAEFSQHIGCPSPHRFPQARHPRINSILTLHNVTAESPTELQEHWKDAWESHGTEGRELRLPKSKGGDGAAHWHVRCASAVCASALVPLGLR